MTSLQKLSSLWGTDTNDRLYISRVNSLTIPPNWTSWSSTSTRIMLLGLSLSAHLTPQVSSADSSVTRDKAECPPPLCGLLVAPALILRSAIETLQRRAWCYTKPPLPFSSFAFLHRGRLAVKWAWCGWTGHTGSFKVWGSGLRVCDHMITLSGRREDWEHRVQHDFRVLLLL